MDIARLIQQKIPLGSHADFTLKSGEKKSGMLMEISKAHITLENNSSSSTIFLDMIGAFDIVDPQINNKAEPEKPKINTANAPILQRLLEIKAQFDIYIKTAKLELRPPDFILPSDLKNNWNSANIKAWNQVKSKFENARKINELDKKFGRVQPLIASLKNLSELMPDSAFLKRHLGYLYFLDVKFPESFACFKESAISSNELNDWYNLAVLALLNDNDEAVCYSLGKYFCKKIVNEDINAWYIYTKLLIKFSYYSAIPKLLENSDRKLTDKEQITLLETAIYCLLNNERKAATEEIIERWLANQQSIRELIIESVNNLHTNISEAYLTASNEFEQSKNKRQPIRDTKKINQIHGVIQTSLAGKNFGFLYDSEGEKYLFHKSAIIDETLVKSLSVFSYGNKIPVVFEIAQNPTGRGPIAVQISQVYSTDALFKKAKEYANDGEYAKAIAQIRRVLATAPDFPYAQEYFNKWKEYALLSSVPKGSNPYARAKRAQLIEKDLERAVELFKESIKRKDNLESAIKDLAMLYVQMGKNKEAIDVLTQNKTHLKNQQSLDELFITIYKKMEKYTDAINLLQKRIGTTTKEDIKEQLLLQIANLYLRAKGYKDAEESVKQVLKLNSENVAAQRILAVCLSQLGNYNDAKTLLNKIIEKYSDSKAAELLEALQRAQITGEPTKVDEIIIETGLSDFSIELSSFAKFFLKRCEFENTIQRAKDFKYIGSEKEAEKDIKRLEELATEHGTRRPRGRSQCYLEAAKVILDIDGDRSLFYRYLCRSFTSKGDTAVIENKNLDSIREWYADALKAYDGCSYKDTKFDEQDAVNALTRFLFSLMGRSEIPTVSPRSKSEDKEIVRKEQLQYIDNAIEKVILSYPDRKKVFDVILHIVLNSRYAAQRLFNGIYSKQTLQATALEYLRNKGANIPQYITKLEDFLVPWNDLRRKKIDELRTVYNELKLLSNFDLTTGWLSDSLARLSNIGSKLIFDLDNERLRQLKLIFENCLDLCKQTSFEEQERLCMQIDNRCHDFLNDIELNPTQISIEQIYDVVEIIQKRIKKKLEDLYETSKPQLELQLPIESYVPDNNQQIEVQISITNRIGRSPAESVEIIVQPNEEYFSLMESELKMVESLSGDKQKTIKIPLRVNNQAIQARAFSLGIYVQYRTRSNEIEQTPVNSFSIRLYPEDEFEEIENPYASYAEGGVVGNPEMFYGREELIKNITNSIQKSRNQSKSIIIYGQKRAGKSSILFHLKNLLQKEKNLLVIDLGNIGALLDEFSSIPLLYQILWTILSKLKTAAEDLIENDYPSLDLTFPSDMEFYKHPAPMSLFKEVFDKYKRERLRHAEWINVHLLLLIDEFSYIYDQIVSGKMSNAFMKNWKAILQENYFSCVLAGQDVMPKFKQHFPNEFGTTQDERVTYLKADDAIKLIDEPLRIGGQNGESRYRGKAIQRILDLTAGSPFYVQILCNRLVEYMNHKHAGLITDADVEQVKHDLIKGVNALDITKFDNLINSGDTSKDAISDADALIVLKEIAVNSITGHCHRNNINCETTLPIDCILEDLVKRDVIEREREHYYQINVGLLKEWLILNK